jgi:DNA-directed RNA polymerase subunit RPC12/RpoP
MFRVVLCHECGGTGFDPKASQRVRCKTCGGSGLVKPPDTLASIVDDPKHWRNRAEEARSLAEAMRDEHTQSMIFRIAEGYDKIATRIEKRHTARDNTAGDVSVGHIPGFIGNVRDSLDVLVAAGVERSALEQRLQKLESAAASEDKGLIHETLVELKGFVTNSATKLVSTGVVSLIDQILGFPSP